MKKCHRNDCKETAALALGMPGWEVYACVEHRGFLEHMAADRKRVFPVCFRCGAVDPPGIVGLLCPPCEVIAAETSQFKKVS